MALVAILSVVLSATTPQFDRQAACAAARAIYEEAGRNVAAAEKLALERGYTRREINLAKRYCK